MDQPPTTPAARSHVESHALSSRSTAEDARELAVGVARLLADDKCEGVLVLDVTSQSTVTDYLVIATGTSDRQMGAALDHAVEFGKEHGLPAVREHRDDRATWLLADFVDVVLHLFEPNTRAHYDIEGLYDDATEVPWARPDQVDRNRAGLRPDERLEQ